MTAKTRQFGMHIWFGYRTPIEQRAAQLRAAGFERSSIWWDEDLYAHHGMVLRELPAILRDAGLVIDNFHPPFGGANDLWSPDASARSAYADTFRGWIEDAARFEVRKLVFHLHTGKNFPDPTPEGLDLVEEMIAFAGQHDVRLLAENLRSGNHLETVLSTFESPWLCWCFDSSHDALSGLAPGTLLAKWGHRLAATHLADNDLSADLHWPLRMGRVNFEAVAAAFPRETYDGPLMLEIVSPETSIPIEDFLRRCYDDLLWFDTLIEQFGTE